MPILLLKLNNYYVIKSILIILICLSFATVASAQQKDLKDPRYKKYAGRYGSSSGIVLFDDGAYLLYGYATVVVGTYRFENDQLFFSADHHDDFEVFAHRNTTLTEGARINFVGFERGGRTFVQLGSDSIRPVFNGDANCFDGPFVYMNAGKMQRFTITPVPPDFSKVNAAVDASWAYSNKAGYNDFIFVHYAARREVEDFVAIILSTEKGEVMKLSSFGGEQGYLKQKRRMIGKCWI